MRRVMVAPARAGCKRLADTAGGGSRIMLIGPLRRRAVCLNVM